MKLLFIGPKFYGYEKAINKILVPRYERVYFCDEVPYNLSIYYNAIKRICPKIAERISRSYNRSIVNLVLKQNIDFLFIIRGNTLSEHCLASIRKGRPNIQIINYQWDSIANNPNGLLVSKYADRNYSFDLADVSKYNGIFQHVPLFYSWDGLNKNRKNKQPEVDLFFLGSYHSSRHEIVKILQRQSDAQGLTFRSYIYIPRLVYYRRKLIGEKLQRKDFTFQPMSRQDYLYSMMNTKIVLDIHSPTQSGATMRTIETLSLGRKLISTNAMLKNELFYSASNIHLWDGMQELDLKNILQIAFDHTYDKQLFSISEWLKKLGL